jgi:hypothetical protein
MRALAAVGLISVAVLSGSVGYEWRTLPEPDVPPITLRREDASQARPPAPPTPAPGDAEERRPPPVGAQPTSPVGVDDDEADDGDAGTDGSVSRAGAGSDG